MRSQLRQRIQSRQITHAVTRLRQSLVSGRSRLGIVDHAHIHHAAIDLRPVDSLHENAGGVQAHVSTGFPRSIAIPVPHLLGAEHRALLQQLAQSFADGLRGPFHRRFTQIEARQLVQRALGGFAEAFLNPRQRRHFLSSGRQTLRRQTQGLIPRQISPVATDTMVVGTRQLDRSQQADNRLGPILDAPGTAVATRAAQARPLVPLFFRSSKAVSMAWAPSL